MHSTRESPTKFVALIITALFFGSIALWQLYMFIAFRDATGELNTRDGINHLWYAIGLIILAFLVPLVAGILLLHRAKLKETRLLGLNSHSLK